MLLTVDKLWVYYGQVQALRDVSVYADDGEIVSVIGLNGAGKSTLLKTIMGQVKPASGSVSFRDQKITGKSTNEIVKGGIALVPEGRQVFATLSVYDNLMAGAYIRSDAKQIQEDIKKYCSRFPILGQRLNQRAGYMSGGEQQMLALARALMSRPKIMLLDEPSLGLEPVVIKEVYGIIEEIRREGTTIFLVEQNAKRALSVADRAYVLVNGEITLTGSGEELLNNDVVRQAYLGV